MIGIDQENGERSSLRKNYRGLGSVVPGQEARGCLLDRLFSARLQTTNSYPIVWCWDQPTDALSGLVSAFSIPNAGTQL